MDWKEVLLSGFLPVIRSVASAQVAELVNHLEVGENDVETFKQDLKGFDAILDRLQTAAAKTKTPWDDMVVGVIHDPVISKGAELGIDLNT